VRIVYGTGNRAKFDSMKTRLMLVGIEIVKLSDAAPDLGPPVEDGGDPLENARIKARFYYSVLKRPVFSADSGFYSDELPDGVQPGVNTREINGKRLNDDEMIEYYSSLAVKYGGSKKRLTARYRNAVCLYVGEDEYYEHSGRDIDSERFYIVTKPHGRRVEGFPLDSLSVHIESGQYYYDRVNQSKYMLDYDGFAEFFKRCIDLVRR
jgi:8-oxo-dGTP diphosphatase